MRTMEQSYNPEQVNEVQENNLQLVQKNTLSKVSNILGKEENKRDKLIIKESAKADLDNLGESQFAFLEEKLGKILGVNPENITKIRNEHKEAIPENQEILTIDTVMGQLESYVKNQKTTKIGTVHQFNSSFAANDDENDIFADGIEGVRRDVA